MSKRDIEQRAIDFARKNKKKIAKRITDIHTIDPDDHPISIFTAGSPGSGKTEFSKSMLSILQQDGRKVVRIDPDELREEFEEYNGRNSSLFQSAASILVDAMKKVSGTFFKKGVRYLF